MNTAAAAPRHGLAAGVQPSRADWTIDQGWARYTPAEHATWRTLFERQTQLLPGRACDEFVQGMQALPIGAAQIPDFRALGEVLLQRTGWQVVAVPGLVPDNVFFEHLAHRRFPAGNFIRRPEQLDYLEEPDVFHDVFGLADASPNRIGLTLERVMRRHYRIDDFQETYFVSRDLDALLEFTRTDFAPRYERVRQLPELQPGEVLEGDQVFTRGSGRHHAKPGSAA